ncbi:olfactory receptor 1f45-like [Ambystoma mexicanum]|uniref:olfactory receptor 1f45-like n=1 Tax=Ambystoma mexicanum TaxID=8296 RepID=UPI0037E8F104
MLKENHSSVPEFILLGFSEPLEHTIILFVVFLIMYLVTLVGNSTIIFIIRVDAHLHTPMYFFLSILSFVDICLTTCTVPKLLINIFLERKSISFVGCFLQLHFFLSFGNMTGFLLAIMAVDRYLAISKPLHYAMLMSRGVRVRLVAGSWVIISLHSAAHSVMAARLSYCASNEIRHYFCDLPPLFKLSCSDTSPNELLLLTETTVFLMSPFLCITISYILIIITICGMPSTDGRYRAFSTCSSHLTAVALNYGPVLYTYIRPASAYSLEKDIIISVLYSVGNSLLNPFVYSIRNKEVKGALSRILSKRAMFWNK